MLKELHIRNYAVIDEVYLELGPGLTVLTGETGAGKSIVAGALSLLLGERTSAAVVREGEERALVEATFGLEGRGELRARLQEAGLDIADDEVMLRREVQREGRNRAWVGGSRTTMGFIRELGSVLVDFHGQHEHQALLRSSAQRSILDAYGGAARQAARVAEAYRELTRLAERLAAIERHASDVREREEYLRFQAEEIENAELEIGEDEQLASEARRLEHSAELVALSCGLYEAVYGEDGSLVERLGALGRPLRDLASIDPETKELQELWEAARAGLEELGRRLGDYRNGVEHDPARLQAVQARLDLLFRLKSKYGRTLDVVLATGEKARTELEELEGSKRQVDKLKEERSAGRARLLELASELGVARRAAAARLEKQVNRLLPELGMTGGQFRVALQERAEPTASGAESVEFYVALNPGFPPAPLAKVASGGEMSRVMLALKSVLAEVDRVPCLVFDEIDAGIGGKVAHKVAERLARVADRHQVLAVTHLPHIAARASRHFFVEKVNEGGRAVARVRRLEGKERVEELARMLGGDPESDVSRRHAEELLEGSVA